MQLRFPFVFPLLALVLGAVPLGAQQSAQQLPADPHVVTGTLPNGLRYYVRENRRPEQRAELRLVVNAGSILEDDDQLGLAHFVEHMAFNGTRNFEKQELVAYLESIGMRFGADLNAYTSFDETVYMLQVPTDSMAPLVQALQILEDWAHGITFDAAEIEKERGVVMEEWRLGQGAGERLRKQYFPTLFRDSRYAERLPIGTPAVLETFTREQLVRFYHDWYRPDLMAVVAVGDFDAAVVERLIRDRFGRMPAASSPRVRATYPVPGHAETLVAIATDPEATGTIVEVDWKLPPQEQGTVAGFRHALAGQLHGRMLNARLAEITQRADPPFIGAGSSRGNLIRTRDVYALGAAVQDGGAERGLHALLTEAQRVVRHGFTASELERQKANVLRGFERAFAERERTESGMLAAEYVRAFLHDEAIPGIEAEHELARQLLPAITLAEVNALSGAWMTGSSPVVIVTAPEREGVPLPTQRSLLDVFDAVTAADIAAYDDVVSDLALLPVPPVAGHITASRPVPGTGATLLELSNGARVFLKPTDFKNDQVLMGAYSPGGLSLVDDSVYASATFAAQLVSLSGVGELDAIQLEKVLAGRAAGVRAAPGEFSEGMSGSASPRDLETLFQLAHLHFTAPRSDSVAFESFMSRMRAALANRGASPEAAFSDTFAVTLWQGHPRARPQDVAVLDEVDRDTAFRIFRDRFADAGDFSFVFVGTFDTDSILPLVETYIASLPSAGRVEQPRDTGMRPVRGVVEKVVRRGVEPKSQTRITFTGAFDNTPQDRLSMALLVEVLDMKLRDVLREDLGGTYGVSVSHAVQRFPEGRYSLSIAFGAAPGRLEELVATVFTVLESVKADGPDATALANAREQQRRAFETNLRRNEYWLSLLLRQSETGEPAADALAFPQRLDAVTAAQVQDAARRYLDTENYVRVSLVPEG
jgi:zinc protease